MIKVNYNKKIKNKKYCKLIKGFRHLKSCLSGKIVEQIKQTLFSSYIGRKLKKRTFNFMWIFRINSALRKINIKYSIFIGYLKKLNIFINKKMLSILTYTNIFHFFIFIKIIKIYINFINNRINLYYNYIKFLK